MKKESLNYLRFLPIGGCGDVTKNMHIYETERDILIVDCGIGFVEKESEDNLLEIPDIDYLKSRVNKIRAILITHAHEDHFGALPFVYQQLGRPPIFASRLTAGFIKAKMADYQVKNSRIQVINPYGRGLKIGDFYVDYFLVNHSVPDSLAYVINTSAGKIFHVADHKFDLTPVNGRIFDFQKCTRLAQGKTMALFSDCLGATEPGYTESEQTIKETFAHLLSRAPHQVFITTLSSNISRLQQAIDVSRQQRRKIVVLGRSLEESIRIAKRLGYLKVSDRDIFFGAKRLPLSQLDKVTFLIAGSYGQENSALYKLAKDNYEQIKIRPGTLVIFSADPAPPGTREKVDKLVDLLTYQGAQVHYYEIQENLHVSGHGSSQDIKLLFSLVKPRYYIPIGGHIRHQRAYNLLAQELAVSANHVFELLNGDELEFLPTGPRIRRRTIKLTKKTIVAN